MNEREGRSAAEIAAAEECLYRFMIRAFELAMLWASGYGGWQVGLWIVKELA